MENSGKSGAKLGRIAMKLQKLALGAALIAVRGWRVASMADNRPGDNDPYSWLSEINGAKALSWVKAQNAKSDGALKSDPSYKKDYAAILKVLNANDRVPEPDVVDHQWVFNF